MKGYFFSILYYGLISKTYTGIFVPTRMRKIKSNEKEMSLCYIWQVSKLKYSDLETLIIYHIRDADILEIINLLTQQSSVGFFSTFLWCLFSSQSTPAAQREEFWVSSSQCHILMKSPTWSCLQFMQTARPT